MMSTNNITMPPLAVENPPSICRRCTLGGCDLKVLDCGCCFHTRCYPVTEQSSLGACPLCRLPARTVLLLPMTFDEIDRAQAEAASTAISNKRGKKRKNATISRLDPSQTEASELRTGRWTTEETAYCDKLIQHFEEGSLPIPDGIKLNDFLSNMLKSKQSRLTKKMKNAKLSARSYKRFTGYILDDAEARELSVVENEFYASVRCSMERSEIRFHIQKEWRELFSSFCVEIGRRLDGNAWLQSVEELDRRASLQKDAARMARRKEMMGYALRHDTSNPDGGVFIDPNVEGTAGQVTTFGPETSDSDTSKIKKKQRAGVRRRHPPRHFSSAFVGKLVDYIQRNRIPFEHADVWVPSFISNPAEQQQQQQACRLCFAGCGTTETHIPNLAEPPVEMSVDEQFDLISFGEYSQKFSFDIGSGLPGRVYSSGNSSWERGIQNAPVRQFERKGGAVQWGIQTVLGIPVPSPNVGRIAVLLYSRYDRAKNEGVVTRIADELSKLMPSPRWKLVVDVGVHPKGGGESDKQFDTHVQELVALVQKYTPENKNSPLVPVLPGFSSLRVLLLNSCKSEHEKDLLKTAIQTYRHHKMSGKSDEEVACLTARDFMDQTRSQLSSNSYSQSVGSAATAVAPAVPQNGNSGDSKPMAPSQSTIANTSAAGLYPMNGVLQTQPVRDSVISNATSGDRGAVDTSTQAQSEVAFGSATPNANVGLEMALASPSLQGLFGHTDSIPPLNSATMAAFLQSDGGQFHGL